MGVLSHTASALAIISYATANPIVQRTPSAFKLPQTYAALGDSFSSGLGSGQFLNDSADALDIACLRQDGSYPTLLTKLLPGLTKPNEKFDFVCCSGDYLIDIPRQITRLNKKKFDLVTLTIGGNDFDFDDVALNCVYPVLQQGVDAQALCDASFIEAEKKVIDPAFWANFTNTLTTLTKDVLEPEGHLFVTGYARFFAKPIVGDACDHLSFFPVAQIAALNSTAANRQRGNDLGDSINKGIEDTVSAFSKHLKRDNHHKEQKIDFINFDKFFEGKRFCEQDNKADPIGANNAQVFFNDLTTVLPTPGVAPLANQTVGLTGVDITNTLQQVSVFHPKGKLPYVGLAVEIAFRVLLDAVDMDDVVVGPAEWCYGKEAKTHWSRDHKCYDVPADCAIVKTTTEEMGAPTVYCVDGKKWGARPVQWKTEYDW